MKALIYRDFSESYETREIGNGKIKDVLPEYPEDKYAVLVNGIRRERDFEILPGDIVAVRSIPHVTGALIAGAVVAAVGAVAGGVIAYKAKKDAQRAQEAAEELAESLSSSSSSVTQDPTLPGASNETASGKTQPYIMGRRLWTPSFITDEWDEMRGCYWQEAVTTTLSANLTLTAKTTVQKQHGDESYKYSATLALTFLSDWAGEVDITIRLGSYSASTIKKGETHSAGDTVTIHYYNLSLKTSTASVAGTKYSFGISWPSKKGSTSATQTISQSFVTEAAHYEKDNTEYNFRVLQAGFVSQAIEEVRADDETLIKFDTPVTSAECAMSSSLFPDSRIEIRQDGEEFSDERFSYKMDVQEVNDELKLSDDDDYEDLVYTLPVNTKEVYIPLEFPSGLYTTTDSGSRTSRTIKTLAEYSTDGGETYSTLSSQFGQSGVITATKKADLYFILTHTFEDSEILNAVQNAVPIKIRISCLTGEVSSGTSCDSMQVVKVRSRLVSYSKAKKSGTIEYEPLLSEKVDALSVKIGLCLVATSSNEDKASKIQIITCGMARVWDSETREWSSGREATRNPAAWLLETLTSRTHPASAVSDDEIDLESMGDFYEYCDENELHIDLVVDTGDTKENILKKILETGNAGLYRSIYGKIAVAIDDKKENAIAVLNQQNIVSFSAEKNLTRNTDGYRVTFTENDTWEEDTQVFMRDGSDYDDAPSDVEIEEVTIDSFTADSAAGDYSQVYKHIRRQINADILRAHSYSIEIGKEGYFFPLYSRVKITHPALYAGLGSSTIESVVVTDGKITALKLCSPVQYSTDARYGAVIQCVSTAYSRILSAEYVADNEEPDYISLAEPIDASAETVPHAGNILSYGTLSDDGTFETITNEMTVTEIKPTTNGFQLAGVDYSDDLFEYGTIPEYVCNLTRPRGSLSAGSITNDDILEAAEKAKDEIEKTIDGTLIESSEVPADVASVSAVAAKDGITLSAVAGGSTIYDSARNFLYQISRDSGGSWEDIDGSYYTFDRSVDGYPEKTDLASYLVRAKTVNAYGNQSENWTEGSLDTSSYGTWKFNFSSSNIASDVRNRTLALTLSTSGISGASNQYGTMRYRISISRSGFLIDDEGNETETSIADTDSDGNQVFYAPSLTKNPYPSGTTAAGDYSGNEDNYKDESNTDGFVLSDSSYSQTVPLYGQEKYTYDETSGGWESTGKSVQDTTYIFKVQAVSYDGLNVVCESDSAEVSVTALCSSLRDIVYAHTYYKDFYVQRLSAISANVGLISEGGFGDFENLRNFWALSDLGTEDTGLSEDVKQGAFKVGGEKNYIAVIPSGMKFSDELDNTSGTDFMVAVKAGNITLTTSGTELTSGTYVYDETDSSKRMHLLASGIEIQLKQDGSWISKGKFVCDSTGNLIVTNDGENTSCPDFGTGIDADGAVYRMENSVLDENGGNAASFTFSDSMECKASSLILSESYLMKGTAEKTLAAEDVCLWTDTDVIAGGNIIKLADNTANSAASVWNTKTGTSFFKWGN